MNSRRIRAPIALLLVLSLILGNFGLAGSVSAIDEENLLANGDFEIINDNDTPAEWIILPFDGGTQIVSDQAEAQSGSYSARFSATSASRGALMQRAYTTEDQNNKHYQFSQWIKTEDFSGAAYFRIQVYDQDRNRLIYKESERVTTTNGWQQVSFTEYMPQDTYEIRFEFFIENARGIAWFDNTVIAPIELEQTDLITNGGFEETISTGMPSEWNTHTFSGNPEFSTDDTVARSGERSAKIQASNTSRAVYVQRFNLNSEQVNKQYRVEQWVKTEDFTGIAYFRIQVYDAENNRIHYLESNQINRADDWQKIAVEFHLLPEADRVVWEAFFENGSGTVWYDDTSFVEYIPVSTIALNHEEINLNPDESMQLEATVYPEDATEQIVSWVSSNEEVATVHDGLVTAHEDGLAAVSAVAMNGVRADAVVVVGDSSEFSFEPIEISVDQRSYTEGTFEAQTPDETSITYSLLTSPQHGAIQITPEGDWIYFAAPDYSGDDYFYVQALSAGGLFTYTKVSVTILPLYEAPVLEEIIQPTDLNTEVAGGISVLQANGEELTFELQTEPVNGELSFNTATGRWVYTPDQDYTGKDSFRVEVMNEHGESSVTTVRLYTAPSSLQIIAELEEYNSGVRKPSLIATDEDFARIRNLISQGDPHLTEWFEGIQSSADSMLNLAPQPYNKPDGLRLDTSSGSRVSTLAFVYQITGDAKYADRAWEEIANVSSEAYPDWSPQHYLDTATMTTGIALGYDWLYDYLTVEQRAITRDAIAIKGLTPAVDMYLNQSYWWVYNNDNWNFVCNAGMTLGALAIADEEAELSGLILREAFKSIQHGLTQYAPDGSSIEGPSYWEYGTMYLVYFLSALETSFGHDFDMSDREGIAETAYYPIHITGPNGGYNHSDNSEALIPGRLLLWFAERYDKPEFTWYHQFVQGKTSRPGMYDMIWYRPDTYGETEPAQLDQMFVRPEAVTMRSSWNDPNALFVGFKGGVNGAPHGDLDTGSFVFDANGVRWAMDLGSENYNLPGYWSMSEDGARWSYYRKRAEGHNTLVINPTAEGPDQKVDSHSEITKTVFEGEGGAYAVADLTPAYIDSAASVKRAAGLINHRREFLVQDEIKLKEPADISWYMHTRAEISIDEAGTTAILRQDSRELAVQIVAPSEAVFTVLPAEPLPGMPNPDGQTRNLGIRKLAIQLENQLETQISVHMIPLMSDEDIPEATEFQWIDDWAIEEAQPALLNGITIDGDLLEGFNPRQYVYDIHLTEVGLIPQISASAEDNLLISVEQATGLPGTSKITVTDPDGVAESSVYYVNFHLPEEVEMPEGARALTPISVTASTHDGNVPENTLDGDLTTRWSAEGDEWIQYDLGRVTDVNAVSIAWYQGSTRQSYFQILLSEDGVEWTQVHEGFSSGTTTDLELNVFDTHPARYIRINGMGNSQNRWNSMAEFKAFGPGAVGIQLDTPSVWAIGDTETFKPVYLHADSSEVDALDVTIVSSNPSVLSVDGLEGTALRAGTVELTVMDNEFGLSTTVEIVVQSDVVFPDLPEGFWANEYIYELSRNGIVEGFEDGTFRPYNTLNRSQVAAMMVRALNLPVDSEAVPSFSDVPADHPYAPYIAAAEEAGIFKGKPDGTFGMWDPISRRQIAIVAVRAFNLTAGDLDVNFTDAFFNPDTEATEAVKILASLGIIEGYKDGTVFKPYEPTNRAQFAKILAMAMDEANIEVVD